MTPQQKREHLDRLAYTGSLRSRPETQLPIKRESRIAAFIGLLGVCALAGGVGAVLFGLM